MSMRRVLAGLLAAAAAAAGTIAFPTAARAASTDTNYQYTIRLSRVSNTHPVVIVWGDGTTTRRTSSCTPATVRRSPAKCSMRLTHSYAAGGRYDVVLKFGRTVIGRQKADVAFGPNGWVPPAGWIQPAGWKPYADGATFAPCSTVRWYYDATGQPAASAGMVSDVAAGLALLAPLTGLTFTQTADPATAQLVYRWADLSPEYGGDVGGVGGRDRTSAYVTFSTSNWWPADSWAGFDVVTQPDGRYAGGRGWLVVHETMHALGFDHVDDPGQVMNPVITAHALGAGDLDGLRTMYLGRPCRA